MCCAVRGHVRINITMRDGGVEFSDSAICKINQREKQKQPSAFFESLLIIAWPKLLPSKCCSTRHWPMRGQYQDHVIPLDQPAVPSPPINDSVILLQIKLKRRHDYWLWGRIIAKLAPKNPSRGEGINCESGNSGVLCVPGVPGVRVCIIKQRPSEIMNVWCQAGMWRRCDVLFIIGICVLYISIILFAYSIIIGALSVARAIQTPRYHRVLIVFWWGRLGKCQWKHFPIRSKNINIQVMWNPI